MTFNHQHMTHFRVHLAQSLIDDSTPQSHARIIITQKGTQEGSHKETEQNNDNYYRATAPWETDTTPTNKARQIPGEKNGRGEGK